MTGVNVPLLRKAVEWAEIESTKPRAESQWEQDAYRYDAGDAVTIDLETEETVIKCNTAYCIAGWTVAMTLRKGEYQDASGDVYSTRSKKFVADVEVRALEELGLETDRGLFDCQNTIQDVRRIAEELAGENL